MMAYELTNFVLTVSYKVSWIGYGTELLQFLRISYLVSRYKDKKTKMKR